jgi:hypothetical protein
MHSNDFFVIDAYHSNHDHIILGRPFLKLVDAVLDAGESKVTMNLNGIKYTYNFLRVSKHPTVGHTPRVLMQGRRKSRRRTPTRIPLYSY